MKRIGIGRAKQAALHKPFRKVLFEQLTKFKKVEITTLKFYELQIIANS